MSEKQNNSQNEKILDLFKEYAKNNGILGRIEVLSFVLKVIKSEKYKSRFAGKIPNELIEEAEKVNEKLKEKLNTISKGNPPKFMGDIKYIDSDGEYSDEEYSEEESEEKQKKLSFSKSKRIDLSDFIGNISDDDYDYEEDKEEKNQELVEFDIEPIVIDSKPFSVIDSLKEMKNQKPVEFTGYPIIRNPSICFFLEDFIEEEDKLDQLTKASKDIYPESKRISK